MGVTYASYLRLDDLLSLAAREGAERSGNAEIQRRTIGRVDEDAEDAAAAFGTKIEGQQFFGGRHRAGVSKGQKRKPTG